MSQSITDETRYRILTILKADPQISQRKLAEKLGSSVGKTNYCLRALVDKGWVKARNFRNSTNKRAYAYFLTPAGIDEKARVTVRFLRFKLQEYEALSTEIETLRSELVSLDYEDQQE